MPGTSWSSHYWQPAPRWKLHQWLVKPDNPATSAHTPEKTCTRYTDKQLHTKCSFFPLQNELNNPKHEESSNTCASITKPLTTIIYWPQSLLVANSVKSPLTSLKCNLCMICVTHCRKRLKQFFGKKVKKPDKAVKGLFIQMVVH